MHTASDRIPLHANTHQSCLLQSGKHFLLRLSLHAAFTPGFVSRAVTNHIALTATVGEHDAIWMNTTRLEPEEPDCAEIANNICVVTSVTSIDCSNECNKILNFDWVRASTATIQAIVVRPSRMQGRSSRILCTRLRWRREGRLKASTYHFALSHTSYHAWN